MFLRLPEKSHLCCYPSSALANGQVCHVLGDPRWPTGVGRDRLSMPANSSGSAALASNSVAIKLRSTDCTPTLFGEIQATAAAPAPMPRTGPASYPPLSGNMFLLVLCHRVAVLNEVAAAPSCDSVVGPISHSHRTRPQAPTGSSKRKRRQSAPRPYDPRYALEDPTSL